MHPEEQQIIDFMHAFSREFDKPEFRITTASGTVLASKAFKHPPFKHEIKPSLSHSAKTSGPEFSARNKPTEAE
ncbi:hypothetical protein [Methylovorus glucosotrophus]|uniref:Uncharacterized protein n=1 Tax=Methylovorus glucosotrophus (strain SIP3-4) TaxID=582744 RepID=C6XEB2_METGS|nr:hypothetical protein [Methylovorus glucosotrophus]ACT50887.1 hypothetical protein Msip34_1642 [Methylovorus glucosotrophus SIP3-4]